MQVFRDQSPDARELAEVVRCIDVLRDEIASLQAVLYGAATREQALNAQRLVGQLKPATVLTELAARESRLGQLSRWASALASPITSGRGR